MTAAPDPRLATAADFAAIAAITNHYIRHTTIHFGAEDETAAGLEAAWRQGAELYPWLVVEVDGAVVGYAKAGPFRTRAAYRWSAETGIYLAAAHCGRGLGPPLYRRLCEVLRRQGFHTAIGGITLPNPGSVRLHERLGFVPWGTVVRVGHKFGAWHDVGFWQLHLQPADHEPGPLLPPAVAFARG
ncbi:MAG: N-acetyltransferase [Planctomycetes bacterium]|nr:N-acetyltransferase [Planctomycetota bacterium]